jgi:hypothetical protein
VARETAGLFMEVYNRIREGYIANPLALRNADVNPTMSAANLNILFLIYNCQCKAFTIFSQRCDLNTICLIRYS